MAHRRKVLLAAAAAVAAARLGGSALRFTARTAAARRQGRPLEPDVPAPPPSLGLAGAVALDTLLTLPMPLLSSTGSADHYARSAAELDDAVRWYDDAGWLDDPAGRHPAPARAADGRVEALGGRRTGLDVLRFDSGWQPVDGEPGGERWRGFTSNSVVPVTLLRHPGGPRPWLVAVHGQSMGRASDVRMLGARRLHHALGINVALPVLPLHGPRAQGFAPDEMFVSNVYPVNNVLGLTQSVWDLRRLVRWLRDDQGAPAVGVLGLSLGSYACALLSTHEPDLDCVVAVVPTSDLASSLREAEPAIPSRRRLHRELHDERSALVHRVVSPLARPCLVPHEHRHIVAGVADRVAPPAGAAELWRHWGRPSIEWRPRGHMTTWRSAGYHAHLDAILAGAGLVGG